MPDPRRPTPPFVLSPDHRERLRQDIDFDAFERLLTVLPEQARKLLLRLAARQPDLLAIWEAAPALRAEERGMEPRTDHYRNPRLEMHVVPRLEDVSLSDPVLQRMLSEVLPPGA
ncbi:MAG TPA: hypothetical protein VL157_04750 [Gemmatimonadaceae bacterium]|jgi:hypothetical protein|nr:hypothetical protein [Gemmatimonadaceae bacterium]